MDSKFQVASGTGYSPLGSKVKMHTKNTIKTRTRNTYYIICRMGKQGMHSPRESKQPGVQKCTTGLATSLEKHSDGNHAQGDLLAGPSRVTLTKKKEKDKRQKWSREDYKEVMYAIYMSLENPAGSHTENTFTMWRSHNYNVRINLNGNKLANVRRDIMNKKRLRF